MPTFADDLITAVQNDRIKKNFHDIFESSIKFIIDEHFAEVKRTVHDGLILGGPQGQYSVISLHAHLLV